jgi:hypothetical protein
MVVARENRGKRGRYCISRAIIRSRTEFTVGKQDFPINIQLIFTQSVIYPAPFSSSTWICHQSVPSGRKAFISGPPKGPEFKRVMRATIIDTVWCNEAPNPAERRSSQLKADGDPALLNFPIMIWLFCRPPLLLHPVEKYYSYSILAHNA